MRLAHVDQHRRSAFIHKFPEFHSGDLRHMHIRLVLFATNAAKLLVINQFVDGGIFAAHRALGVFRSLSSRNFMPKASKISNRPIRGFPLPRINLMASSAWMQPIMPGRTPSTPPSAQLGTSPGGGGSG